MQHIHVSYPPRMLDFLFESNTWGRAATLRRKILMTSQYSFESAIQHSASTRESLNRSGGYEAFVYFGKFFPLRPDDRMAMEQTARDRFSQFFDDERLVDRVVSTSGAIRMMCSKPDAAMDILERLFQWFDDKLIVARLVSTDGLVGHNLRHPQAALDILERLFQWFGDKLIVSRLCSTGGLIGHNLRHPQAALDILDRLFDLFGDKLIVSRLLSTNGLIGHNLRHPQAALDILERLFQWFGDKLIVSRLLSTNGLIGHDLRHPQAVIDVLERLFDLFGDKDLIVLFLSQNGIIGKLLSDTTKSLKGVDLLVKKIGPVSAATVLCRNSNFMVPYLEDSEVVEKALNELLDHFQNDKAGCQAALTGGISKIGFLKQYVENRDAALRSLPEPKSMPSLRTAIPVKRRLTAEKLPRTEDELGRAAYDVKVPSRDELGPDRKFTVFVDGVECTVTCPNNVRGGMYLQFRPFDSFDFKPAVFCTSSHGLILNKIPGQTLLQLTDVVEGSEGSRCEKVAALVKKKYFLRMIGTSPAPNSIESALKALQAVKASPSSPLVVVFGPPGHPEEVSEL